MAIAHVCMQCGLDLARVRPVREPHYNLRLITCPRCRQHTVRREHPIWSRWKAWLRLQAALSLLITQIVIGMALALAILANIGLALSVFLELVADGVAHVNRLICAGAFLVVAPLTGAWLTAGFSHLARWRAWLGWFLVMSLLTLLVFWLVPALTGVMPFAVASEIESGLRAFLLSIFFLIPAMMVLVIIMLGATAGIPLGVLVLRLIRRIRSTLWRATLRRRRLRRSHG